MRLLWSFVRLSARLFACFPAWRDSPLVACLDFRFLLFLARISFRLLWSCISSRLVIRSVVRLPVRSPRFSFSCPLARLLRGFQLRLSARFLCFCYCPRGSRSDCFGHSFGRSFGSSRTCVACRVSVAVVRLQISLALSASVIRLPLNVLLLFARV